MEKVNHYSVLGYIGLAIKQHLDALPPNLRMTLQQMLDDIKAKKDNLQRSKQKKMSITSFLLE
jgi:hypothetical protein